MPYVRNAWYVAALPDEVSQGLLARTILDEPIVLYRQASGQCAALLDICPHRFAPLSMGMIKDGNVQCPYHGLEFDGTGRCVFNPHSDGAPSAALKVRAFPVVERDGLIWIWPGDPARLDPGAIPDFSCRVAAERRTVGGHARVACNYKLLVDNLMDLGHAQYVHRANAQTDAFHKVQREVVVEDGAIRNLMMFPEGSPRTLVSKFFDFGNQRIDLWNDIRWTAVSAMQNFIAFAPTGTPKDESYNSMGTHIVTPETEGSCHYFFGVSRNFSIDDPKADEVFRAWQKQALINEDKPIVEAIEGLGVAARRHGMRRTMLACDQAAMLVMRAIDKLETLEVA